MFRGKLSDFVLFTLLVPEQSSRGNFIKKETLTKVFSCEFCKIPKNTFYYRTPLVAASSTVFKVESRDTRTSSIDVFSAFTNLGHIKNINLLFPLLNLNKSLIGVKASTIYQDLRQKSLGEQLSLKRQSFCFKGTILKLED